MKSPFFLFKNAVIDHHARLANHLDVQPAEEFAERMLALEVSLRQQALDPTVESDDAVLDSLAFMDRTHELRAVFGGAQ